MSDSKEAQAARNEVDRQMREENPERWAELMHAAFAKRDLVWNRRATKEERERREAEEKQAKARARIEAEAKKAGLQVSFYEADENPSEAEQEAEREHVAALSGRIGGHAKEFLADDPH